jgi:hypothetical protein
LSVYVDDNVTVISEKPAESSDDDFDFGDSGLDEDTSMSDDSSAEDAAEDATPEDAEAAPADDAEEAPAAV